MFNSGRLIENLKENFYRMDKMVLLCTYLLVTISTIFVYSATRDPKFVIQNLVWIAVGTFLIILLSLFDYRRLDFKPHIKKMYGVCVVILLLVRFAGKKTLGAQRWLKIGPFQLQPSEFVKIAIVIIIAWWIVNRYQKGINNLADIVGAILPVGPLILLILLQPDLGTTLITVTSFVFMIFLYGANMKPIWIIGFVILLSVYPVYKYVLKDYQRTRVENFLNPEKDLRGSGWHVTQSKISVGAGGITGKGVLQGSQSRLEFLPEAQTDFIFSVISEEMGFVGSTMVLLLYFLLIFNLMRITRFISNQFGKLIISGICGIFFMHVIVNVGMTIGLVPVTGKPLLFMSYGGSSFLSSFIMIGLAQSIRIHSEEG